MTHTEIEFWNNIKVKNQDAYNNWCPTEFKKQKEIFLPKNVFKSIIESAKPKIYKCSKCSKELKKEGGVCCKNCKDALCCKDCYDYVGKKITEEIECLDVSTKPYERSLRVLDSFKIKCQSCNIEKHHKITEKFLNFDYKTSFHRDEIDFNICVLKEGKYRGCNRYTKFLSNDTEIISIVKCDDTRIKLQHNDWTREFHIKKLKRNPNGGGFFFKPFVIKDENNNNVRITLNQAYTIGNNPKVYQAPCLTSLEEIEYTLTK